MKVKLITREEFLNQGFEPNRPRVPLQKELKASSTPAEASTDKKNDFGYSRPAPKPQPKKKGAKR